MRTPAPVLALTLALAALPAAAQQAAKPELSRQDRHFTEHALDGGIAEVQLGKLADQRAGSEAVRTFGQRMVTDHSEANQKLSAIANRLGMPAPKEISRGHRHTVDRLTALSGADFDRAYMQTMVEDHRKDVKEFRKQAEDGQNAELKSFAQQTVPTLEQHLRLAEDTQAKLHGEQAQVPR
ncbi:MAG: DUF4142 domain-containing protein [Magnetospirillum sp.]|nr:DUF4142 domain-containing protein [Magnetospirillum sp.]